MNPTSQPSEADLNRPWWRYPIVWMVVGGPLAVVIAALITAGIAMKHVDPVLDSYNNPKAAEKFSESPALQARNHSLEHALQPADR